MVLTEAFFGFGGVAIAPLVHAWIRNALRRKAQI